MRYAKGINTDLLILTCLAAKKEARQYDLPKLLKTTYRTVLRHLQPLEEKGLIKVIRTEPSEKRGKDRKIYTLTIGGVITILGHESTYEMIDTVAKNYADVLPYVFGKWYFFIKENKRDVAIKRMALALQFFQQYVSGHLIAQWSTGIYLKQFEEWRKKQLEFQPRTEIAHDFTNAFLAGEIFYNTIPVLDSPYSSELKKWLGTLKKDHDLKNYMDKVLTQKERSMKFIFESLMTWKKWWKS